MLGALNAWARSRSATALMAICLMTVGLLGVVDYLTGYESAFSIFYLAPICVAAWYLGLVASLSLSLISAATWLAVDISSGHAYPHPAIAIWNLLVWLGSFVLSSHLIVRVRGHLRTEAQLARTDPVTGLMNGRALREEAERYLRLAARHNQPLSVAYIDLDDFKRVNDRLGHTEGDRLLRGVARVLKRSARAYDLTARVGGDEFAAFLPFVDAAGAEEFAARTRAHLWMAARDHGWPVTFSMGVVTFVQPPESIDRALEAADALMYQVKKNGKDGIAREVRDRTGSDSA